MSLLSWTASFYWINLIKSFSAQFSAQPLYSVNRSNPTPLSIVLLHLAVALQCMAAAETSKISVATPRSCLRLKWTFQECTLIRSQREKSFVLLGFHGLFNTQVLLWLTSQTGSLCCFFPFVENEPAIMEYWFMYATAKCHPSIHPSSAASPVSDRAGSKSGCTANTHPIIATPSLPYHIHKQLDSI